MPYVDELKPDEKLFALFVSRSGGGKSTAAACFPTPEFMDFDGRIRGLIPTKHIYNQRVSFEEFLPGKGWNNIDDYLELAKVKAKARMFGHDTLVFDSLSSFLVLMLNEGIDLQQGKKIGKLRMAGPGDYNYESSAVYQAFDSLRNLTKYINVIVTAHIIPRYGKPPQRDSHGNIITASDGTELVNPYAESEEVGEKLSVRDKIEANTMIFFNEIYRFEKKKTFKDGKPANKFVVEFDSDIARSALGLSGEYDITDKNFFDLWKTEVNKVSERSKQLKAS